jgi:3-methyladenine DNA glycosylase AlkD
MNELEKLEEKLKKAANPIKAKILQGFFKTGKGEYGEGDVFLGIIVPVQRKIAREFFELSINEIQELLNSQVHEKRLIALLILIEKFRKASKEKDEETRAKIFEFYLKNTKKINSWDLVDLSAQNIIGNYLLDKEKDILYELAKSDNLWEKRISIVATFAFIRNNEYNHALKISEILLEDSQDLIHKAVGWMLREIGKKNVEILEDFLGKYSSKMPRTMLRYAIERFDEEKRKRWLNGEM